MTDTVSEYPTGYYRDDNFVLLWKIESTTIWDRPTHRFVSTSRPDRVVKLRLSPREMKD